MLHHREEAAPYTTSPHPASSVFFRPRPTLHKYAEVSTRATTLPRVADAKRTQSEEGEVRLKPEHYTAELMLPSLRRYRILLLKGV